MLQSHILRRTLANQGRFLALMQRSYHTSQLVGQPVSPLRAMLHQARTPQLMQCARRSFAQPNEGVSASASASTSAAMSEASSLGIPSAQLLDLVDQTQISTEFKQEYLQLKTLSQIEQFINYNEDKFNGTQHLLLLRRLNGLWDDLVAVK